MSELLQTNQLSIEKSHPGRRGVRFEKPKFTADKYIPAKYLRKTTDRLPELTEQDTIRHFTNLSRQNYSLDSHFYPLGSCTMKYNPKAYDGLCALEGFAQAHPFAPEVSVQGTLELMYQLQELLKEIRAPRIPLPPPSSPFTKSWLRMSPRKSSLWVSLTTLPT